MLPPVEIFSLLNPVLFLHCEPRMKSLGPPDSHHLSAAIGWLELGNVAEAGAELEKIAPSHSNAGEACKIKQMARQDPDLEPLWPDLRGA